MSPGEDQIKPYWHLYDEIRRAVLPIPGGHSPAVCFGDKDRPMAHHPSPITQQIADGLEDIVTGKYVRGAISIIECQ